MLPKTISLLTVKNNCSLILKYAVLKLLRPIIIISIYGSTP